MLEIAQFGAGRIGQIHASNIAAMQDVRARGDLRHRTRHIAQGAVVFRS